MDKNELKQRTKTFGIRVLRLVDALPKASTGRAIGDQPIRSGTSVGANYRAACRARSRAEFISRLGTVEEEADESAYWLELIIDARLMKQSLVLPLLTEAGELTRIFSKTIATAKINRTKNNQG